MRCGPTISSTVFERPAAGIPPCLLCHTALRPGAKKLSGSAQDAADAAPIAPSVRPV